MGRSSPRSGTWSQRCSEGEREGIHLPRKFNNDDSVGFGEEGMADGEGTFRVKLPNRKTGEMFGIADALLGASHIKVNCADGKSRLARIPGKLRKRMWIREGDLVIVRPWEFQNEKADVVWRYTKTQASYLSRKKLLPGPIDVY